MKMKRPNWTDEEAVADFVHRRYDGEFDPLEEAQRDLLMGDSIKVRIRSNAEIETDAIEDAKRGDFRRLAGLLRRGAVLGPEARALIADALMGTKRTRGRPKMDPSRRSRQVPGAAQESLEIKAFLKAYYPEQKNSDIGKTRIPARGGRMGNKQRGDNQELCEAP
jgi:hypothetical protein